MRVKDSKREGGGVLGRLAKRALGAMVALATLLGGMLVTGTANAAGRLPSTGASFAGTVWHTIYGFPGVTFDSPLGPRDVGIMRRDIVDGHNLNYYCLEWGVDYGGGPVGGGTVSDYGMSPDLYRIAFLAQKYRDSNDPVIHAAIGFLVHDKLDQTMNTWQGSKAFMPQQAVDKAKELWAESIVADKHAEVQYKYTTGQRKGTYEFTGLLDANNNRIVGENVTLQITGPAQWDQTKGDKITFQSGAQPQTFAWTATGDGTVKVDVMVNRPQGQKYTWPQQDFFFVNKEAQSSLGNISFQVKNKFDLKVTTEASNKFEHAGDTRPVHDTIHMEGADGFEDEEITGTVILNWDGNPVDETVDQKVEKKFTTKLVPEIQSPEFTPSDFGWSKWRAGRYWFDVVIPQQGHMEKAVDTDDREPSETWVVDAPHITTDVSKRVVGLNEKFYDTIKIAGRVARGSYVKVQAYSAVPDLPDTSVPLLLDERIDITDKQADESSEQGSFTIQTSKISSPTEGYVYFKATLFNERGDQLDSHDLGIETETVHVLPVVLTSQVTKEQVTFDQWFGDRATVTGIIEPGSYVVFKAYGPTLMDPILPDGTDNPAVTALTPLYTYRVDVTDKQAADSHNRPQTFYSKANKDGSSDDYERSTMVSSNDTQEGGFVYWKATLYGPDGKERATHQLGIPEETVRVEMPTITTQVSDADVSVGDAFHDVATIRGKVPRGSYVTFTAYEAVPGDSKPNEEAGRILDEARVDISDQQSDQSNVKSEFDVVSPDAHSWKSGTVYWVATLHAPSGQVLDKGNLGEETEKVRVRGGGIITSHAQEMGAVGGQLYDEVTIYDETVGHEGNGSGNSHDNASMIPDDAYVIVRLWRNDGHNGQTKGQMVGQIRRDVDQSKFIPFEEGGEAIDGRTNRRGYQTIKVTGEQFTVPDCPADGYENPGRYNPCGAGMYYFTATLYGTDGATLDYQDFGESGDATDKGYPSEERTPVQKYETERAKKWFSVNSDNYADNTISSYDMLKQWAYQESDVDTGKLIGQTDPGTRMRFEIWREDPESSNGDTDVKVWQGKDWALPAVKSDMVGSASVKRDWQKLKSETVDLSDKALFPAGTYYYRAIIQNPGVDTNPAGNESTDPEYNPIVDGNKNIVWYDAKRVKAESFDILEAQSKSVEPLWTNTMRVADTITLTGVIPEGSKYEAEIWKATEGLDGQVTGSEKVASTGQQPIPAKALGDHRIDPVTFTTKWVDNPGVGSYQWRFKIWTPDMKGGAPELKDGSFKPVSGGTTADDAAYLDENWQSVPQDQASKKPTNLNGYKDRWLIFDGTKVRDEHFEIVRISTDVTLAPTWTDPMISGDKAVDPAGNSQTTPDGEHWVNVSYEGADISDHAVIEGHMLAGYQLGYTLWKRAPGDDPSKDEKIMSTLTGVLREGATDHNSTVWHLNKGDYGDYYWQFNFRKPDGSAFETDRVSDGETKANDAAKRVKAESFHAVSITTATYDWGAVANKVWDTAFIHGKLPEDATIRFDLKDKATGETLQSTKPVKVGHTDANGTTSIESQHLTLKQAGDVYWSEVVDLPGKHDESFHTGRDDQEPESLHGISVDTSVVSEVMAEQSNVHDTSTLENIAENDRLMASWDLYKVDQNSQDPSKDEYVATVDGKGQALSMGQTEAASPSYDILAKYAKGDWRKAVGEYYWVMRVWDKNPTAKDHRRDLYGQPGDNGGDDGTWAPSKPTVTPDGVKHPGKEYRIVHTGQKRDKEETFRVIHAETKAVSEDKVGATVVDKAIVHGPVAKGTTLSWSLYRDDFDPKTAKPLETHEDYATISAQQAETARKTGRVEIPGPEFKTDRVGAYNWVLSLKRPEKADEPGDKSDPDNDGLKDTVEPDAIFTDTLGNAKETTQILEVTTSAQSKAQANVWFHDTALIKGHAVAGTQVEFELWRRAYDRNGRLLPVEQDKHVLTTSRVTLNGGETSVDSPNVKVAVNGDYYWVEKVYRPTDQTNPKSPVEDQPFHVGAKRLPNETTVVRGGLPATGVAGLAAGLMGVLLLAGLGLAVAHSRRRND